MNYTVRITTAGITLVATLLVLSCFVQAEEYPYSVGQGFEFSSGKYGSSTRTETVFAPFTITANPTERLGMLLEIPYVYQSNGKVVSTVARGSMQGNRATMMPADGANGMTGSGSGMSSSVAGSNQSETGLGDITLKFGYLLLQEKDSMPQVRPTVSVKFPTADRNRSLGTGEFDEGFAVEVSKWFGDWNPFVETGYTLQGKSARFALKDYATYNAGVGYQVAGNFRPILFVKGATAPAEGASSLLEIRLKLKYQATNNTGIEGYIAKGLTTNSPDYGTGLAAYYSF